jgi:hypothetical protein
MVGFVLAKICIEPHKTKTLPETLSENLLGGWQ